MTWFLLPAWSATALLQTGTYTAPPICFLVFLQWFHMMITLCASENAKLLWPACTLVPICILLPFEIWGCSATRILAAASIQEWWHFAQHVWRCGNNLRAASDQANTVSIPTSWLRSRHSSFFTTLIIWKALKCQTPGAAVHMCVD